MKPTGKAKEEISIQRIVILEEFEELIIEGWKYLGTTKRKDCYQKQAGLELTDG